MMALVAILCKHFLSTCPVVSCCVFLLDGENKKSISTNKINGLDITFVTTAHNDQECLALLKEFGLPFKNQKK